MTPSPRSSRAALWLAPLLLVAALAALLWWQAQALAERVSLNEGRTVADLVENIGRWASQYGGVHARTEGLNERLPGNFLTRKVYGGDASGPIEAYHWKNPALIQREVADVVAASGSRARYRLTAESVLNPHNAPDELERQALARLRGAGQTEWWSVQGRDLFYARAVVAQESCLRCHGTAAQAPAFLRENPQFNGGGGFGYVAGQPAGLIAVRLPLPSTGSLLLGSGPLPLVAGAVALAALLWLLSLLRRR